MKSLTFIILFVFTVQFSASSQTGYSSNNNYSGLWLDNASWTKTDAWLPNNPGASVGGATALVNLYGRITRSGNLTIGGGSRMDVYDTLLIDGNLTLNGSGTIVMQPGSVLIVLGDYDGGGGTLISNSGKVVVTGDISIKGSSTVNNNDDFYVYGSIDSKGGSNFNGSHGDESDLATNDPDLYTLVNGGTLPVTFTYLRASTEHSRTIIEWGTASEKNNDYFTVERSENGLQFTDVATVAGAGTKTGFSNYSYTDTYKTAKTLYYRIRQTDFDGKYDFSEIVRFDPDVTNAGDEFQVYPNPSNGSVSLNIYENIDHPLGMTIYNDQGKAVYSAQQEVDFTGKVSLNLEHLAKGVYVVEVLLQKETVRKVLILN